MQRASRSAADSAPRRNPVLTRDDWDTMRAAVLADPGAFHGEISARAMHWFVASAGGAGAWLCRDGDGCWSGWDAQTCDVVTPQLARDFAPWTTAFDASEPPHWRWFVGGRTNACFSKVDRHVLSGHGDEAALIFEGDRWDMSANGGQGAPVDCFAVSRKRLLLETAKCALALETLGLKAGDRIALNMPSIVPQIYWTQAAKRLGIVYIAVFGGFSDKTLSDRIADAGARVLVTSGGSYRNAQVAAFKNAYTDPALDNYVPVATVLAILAETDLELPQADAVTILETVRETLAGEVTVERSDVMRGVGRALIALGKEARIGDAEAARVRIAIASSLVTLPPRVDAVIVVRHTAQPDIVWRDERDRWSHELTDAALDTLLARARGERCDARQARGSPACRSLRSADALATDPSRTAPGSPALQTPGRRGVRRVHPAGGRPRLWRRSGDHRRVCALGEAAGHGHRPCQGEDTASRLDHNFGMARPEGIARRYG